MSLAAAILALLLAAALLAAALLAFVALRRRRLRLRPPRHQHVALTDEDKYTVAPSVTPGDVHIVIDERRD
jgi:hypothetical protein